MKTSEDLKIFIKKRDKAVMGNDLNTFKDFLKEASESGSIPEKQYKQFLTAPEEVQLATMHKMACNIPTMPKERVAIAKKWLKTHGMKPNIF